MRSAFALLLAALAVSACQKTAVKPDTAHHAAPAQTSGDVVAVKAFDHKPQPGEKAVCPVTEEVFTVDEDTTLLEHAGKWYAFCCDGCDVDFAEDPSKFTN